MKTFSRKVEDFKCAQCGHATSGDGYTNHCPNCLWSKHVDVTPGDRSEKCQGMMRPVEVEGNLPGKLKVIHICTLCGARRRCKLRDDDNMDVVTELMRLR